MATPTNTDKLQPITWACEQLRFLMGALTDDTTATRIVDKALHELDSHRWNTYAQSVNRRSRRQALQRRHKARRAQQ